MNRRLLLFFLLLVTIPSLADPNTELAHAIWSKDLTAVNKALGEGAYSLLLHEHRQTWLHLAIVAEFPEAIEPLVNAGALINATDDIGQTAAHLAAADGRTDALQILRRLNANLYAVDDAGQRPVNLAQRWRHQDAVELLNGYETEDVRDHRIYPLRDGLRLPPPAQPRPQTRSLLSRLFCCGSGVHKP